MKRDGADRHVGSARTLRRPELAPGPLRDLKDLVHQSYLAAGSPTLDQMAASIAEDESLSAAPSRDTIQRIITSSDVPPRQADVCALVTVLARWAGVPKEQSGQAAQRVAELWAEAKLQRPLGQPIRDLTNPLDLEVHRAIDGSGFDGEQLPLLLTT